MFHTTTTVFQPVKVRREESGRCPVCGRRTVRSRWFEHTINPFNVNAEGVMKSYDEVLADVKAEALAWLPDFAHQTCKES